ncbi:Alpha/Beta hydrolase protein [Favolaschia claudopus]|uniref:carboxypeptidase C n=1 Tax=Favolaschia claudopus TaxID=2862362 RepID=A0AAW0AJ72_9AGAR
MDHNHLDTKTPLLPSSQSPLPTETSRSESHTPTSANIRRFLAFSFVLIWILYSPADIWVSRQSKALHRFYSNVTNPTDICSSPSGPAVSHAGYIGLKGDTETTPKRSFFWFFEAENEAQNAPIILTIGGGPGTSGMLNPLSAQGPCIVVENGTVPNPNRWTEHFNLIALDHPIGVGASYGTRINNSRAAALDVYDFLQKFFRLYPNFSRNQLVVSGGSYGGVYVPHIATVIHEQNIALAAGKGQPGAIHLNLESMMVSNPVSDALSHYRWMLQQRCYNVPDMYNASTCAELFAVLPTCLEAIQFAQQQSEPGPRVAAMKACRPIDEGDRHGTVTEDVRRKCYSTDPLGCLAPSFGWIDDFFQRPDIKDALVIPDHVKFKILAEDVGEAFDAYGDIIQSAYLLHEPLLRDGIRLLHYVGRQDANCAWPGIISFLKLLRSPFQEEFLRTPDVPWPTAEDATVRVVGEKAGNMTYILIQQAGHFVARDQPKLVKSIVDHWVQNVPFEADIR